MGWKSQALKITDEQCGGAHPCGVHVGVVCLTLEVGVHDLIDRNEPRAILDISLTIHPRVHVDMADAAVFTACNGGKRCGNADPISFCRTSSARRNWVRTSVYSIF